MRRPLVFSIVLFLVVTAAAFAQDAYKLETVKGLPGGDVSTAIKGTLQSQGERLMNGAGRIQCEVWLRSELPSAKSPDTSPSVLYGKVAQGAFVGVIYFPNKTTDYRGDGVPSGYYTLRYELVPQDGNHMGVSQYRDFLLLIPAAQDADGGAPVTFDQAVKLSQKATNTGHPGVMMMDAVSDSDKSFPALFQDYSQNWALQAKTQLAGGASYPIAFVLVGKYEG